MVNNKLLDVLLLARTCLSQTVDNDSMPFVLDEDRMDLFEQAVDEIDTAIAIVDGSE